jgi:hypothetical protein
MAHFAWLDENNVVYCVSVVDNDKLLDADGNESEASAIAYLIQVHGEGKTWKQTSYNTYYVYDYQLDDSEPARVIGRTINRSEHAYGGVPFRGTYAGVGFTYEDASDRFIPPAFLG